MANDGIGESTLLSIVIFPAVERNLLDHPAAFCFILSTMEENKSRFLLPKSSGSPKYLPVPPSFWIERVSLTVVFSDSGVLFEKVMVDFSVLID